MVLTYLNQAQGLRKGNCEVCFMDDQNDPIRQGLQMIVEQFESQRAGLGTVRFYELLARKLSAVVRREKAWSWRYVQGVHTGSLDPSKVFGEAVQALGAALDGAPVGAAWTESVRIFAPPGMVREGAVVLMPAKPCKGPGCRLWIVGRVDYCSDECRKQARRMRRSGGRKEVK